MSVNAGEYVGADGLTYRWFKVVGAPWRVGSFERCWPDQDAGRLVAEGPQDADLRAAAAALVALADELETEYVEWRGEEVSITRVKLVAGEPVEAEENIGGGWYPLSLSGLNILAAFRAGQERGKE